MTQSYLNILSNLRPHQEQAVLLTYNHLLSGNTKGLLQMDTGTGKTIICIALIDRLFKQGRIKNALFLTAARNSAEYVASILYDMGNYAITGTVSSSSECQIAVLTYAKLHSQLKMNSYSDFDLVICDDAQHIKDDGISFFLRDHVSMFVGVMSVVMDKRLIPKWLKNIPVIYTYSISDSIKDGYIVGYNKPKEYGKAIESYFCELLSKYGYRITIEPVIGTHIKNIRPDFLLESDEENIIIEIKTFRSRIITNDVVDIAKNQLVNYKNTIESEYSLPNYENYIYCLVLLCDIANDQKERIFNQYNITVWDISNILYICKDDPAVLRELGELLYFPITDVIPQKPSGWSPSMLKSRKITEKPHNLSIAESLEEQLRACVSGKAKKAADEYERICTLIIRFIFEGEFTQSIQQKKTSDELFRMDLLCGIKGISAFWDLIIKHYNTRFIVFEFKNYSDLLPQNLIYVTEKYLFNAALRNVAIIVSRKGFSPNANIAAYGCLKENGKLIISLTDDDLIKMIHKKINGEEASDYLLWKLECLLMSVGK